MSNGGLDAHESGSMTATVAGRENPLEGIICFIPPSLQRLENGGDWSGGDA